MSGLFMGGAYAAIAFADPDAGQGGEMGRAPAVPTGSGSTAPTAGRSSLDDTAEPAPRPATTAPEPRPRVGDGRHGLPSGTRESDRKGPASGKHRGAVARVPSQTDSAPNGERSSSVSAGPAQAADVETTIETVTPDLVPTIDTPTGKVPPSDGDGDEHEGWHWPWCWPTPRGPRPPPDGSPSGTGKGGGGGVTAGKPPIGIGIPKPPPSMQLPATIPRVVSPKLPVGSVDPEVDDTGGLATAAGELPFMPGSLPAIVPPLGAGDVGAGGPGAAPRAGSPAAPKTSGGPQNQSQSPGFGGQGPPAFRAGNGPLPASYRAGYGDYLRTAGIRQMAAVAVPGVTGILVLTGAGGLIGYRQARAGHTVGAGGAARFMG
ncbi:hypothetical protein EAH80_26065 [Mycobacterium hodleri]|uniref:Uncharacterized protein n=2 Tax=Mycolicibacterium hodleri TaxID=49897 RepID=A0A502DZJ6_9MYCO|nr:hypothetical protein EAH80_26065 [Mycolicibacterium hodleri]